MIVAILPVALLFASPLKSLASVSHSKGHIHGIAKRLQRYQHRDTLLGHARRQLDETISCTIADTVFSDEIFFDAEVYRPVCACNDTDTFVELFQETPAPTDDGLIDDYVDDINLEFRTNGWTQASASACENTCTTCFEGTSLCGRMSSEDQNELQLVLPNDIEGFSADDVVGLSESGGASSFAFLEKFNVRLNSAGGGICFSGTEGTICYVLSFSYEDSDASVPYFDADYEGDPACEVSLDGTDCASCSFDLEAECMAADCSNVFPGAIWGCESPIEDFPGPFRPLFYMVPQASSTPNLTVGTCGEETSPPLAVTPAPGTGTPTSAPVVLATEVPTASPVVPATQAPTASPVVPATESPAEATIEPATMPPTTAPVSTTGKPTEASSTNTPTSSPTTTPVLVPPPTNPQVSPSNTPVQSVTMPPVVNTSELVAMVMPSVTNATTPPMTSPVTDSKDDEVESKSSFPDPSPGGVWLVMGAVWIILAFPY